MSTTQLSEDAMDQVLSVEAEGMKFSEDGERFVEAPARLAEGVRGISDHRAMKALELRRDLAQRAFDRGQEIQQANGDESAFLRNIGNYSKGLPHDHLGQVEPSAYRALLQALRSGAPSDFAAIPLGGTRKFTSPQAGLAFDLEGPDAQALAIRPAPSIASDEIAGEMTELYWMALLRDVNFTEFDRTQAVTDAADNLSQLSNYPRRRAANGRVTPATIFRGFTAADHIGPYVSQFLLLPIPYGSLEIQQLNETVREGLDYMVKYNEWLRIQDGFEPPREDHDSRRRYLRNMRDLSHYVHIDALYEAYLNAALILMGLLNAPMDEGNPYGAGKPAARTQGGFVSFGGPHLLSLVTEVATRALKAVWFQKWYVHRRLRPEAFGGLVHLRKTNQADYPIHADLLFNTVLDRVQAHNRALALDEASFLLPMAFPEGSPTHPAYGAGHATVAGACVTILKAWFDDTQPIRPLLRAVSRPDMPGDVVIPNGDGTALVRYTGTDADRMTVGSELNKVASNIAIGRNMAGVHWWSDYTESMKLGERIALGILQEQSVMYNEPHFFTLQTFDGTRVKVENGEIVALK